MASKYEVEITEYTEQDITFPPSYTGDLPTRLLKAA
jgi:hypothetical protein